MKPWSHIGQIHIQVLLPSEEVFENLRKQIWILSTKFRYIDRVQFARFCIYKTHEYTYKQIPVVD